MSDSDRDRWNAKYTAITAAPLTAVAPPDQWLVEAVENVGPGRALDLACGLGHNAIWLAQKGWQVDAVDVSAVGLEIATRRADLRGATVRWIEADLDVVHLAESTYDLVTVFRFLDRLRFPDWIPRLLRPGGRLVYETFISAPVNRVGNHPRNRAFLLEPGELAQLFPALETKASSEVELSDCSLARLVAVAPQRAPAKSG